jgi:hypothetical protein
MSQFIEHLHKASKITTTPMGFGAMRNAQAQPRILLIASVRDIDSARSLPELADGADAVLFDFPKINATDDEVKNILSSIDVPFGTQLEPGKTSDTGNFDFVVLTPDIPLSVTPQGNKIGKILKVESSLEEGLLRAANDLPVDAVFNADILQTVEALSWQNLMALQRLTNQLIKPLLISVPTGITANELKELWETGIDAAVIDVGNGQPTGKMKALRHDIEALDFRPSRKRRKTEVSIPLVNQDSWEEEEEEEEEED